MRNPLSFISFSHLGKVPFPLRNFVFKIFFIGFNYQLFEYDASRYRFPLGFSCFKFTQLLELCMFVSFVRSKAFPAIVSLSGSIPILLFWGWDDVDGRSSIIIS